VRNPTLSDLLSLFHLDSGKKMSGKQTILLSGLHAAPFLVIVIAFQMSIAMAQTAALSPINALQGFSQNCNKPVRIEADTLEMHDKKKVATFLGNVRLVQGDVTLRSKTLDVYYEQSAVASTAPISPAGAAGDQQRIRRIEAKGGVIVTQNGQTATGETAIFDIASNTVALVGSVVITQDRNVVRGDRLSVDLTTGVSRVESPKAGGGVHALIQSGRNPEDKTRSDVGRHAANWPPKPQRGLPPPGHSALC
jgi:lipopolysaccharide export system protein LptA